MVDDDGNELYGEREWFGPVREADSFESGRLLRETGTPWTTEDCTAYRELPWPSIQSRPCFRLSGSSKLRCLAVKVRVLVSVVHQEEGSCREAVMECHEDLSIPRISGPSSSANFAPLTAAAASALAIGTHLGRLHARYGLHVMSTLYDIVPLAGLA